MTYTYKILIAFGLMATMSNGLLAQNNYTLQACIERGLSHNLDIQRSQLSLDIDAIDLSQGKLERYPTLSAGATHGYNWGQTIDPFTNQFASDRVRNNNFFLQSDVALFGGFQIQNSIAQQKKDLAASELDVQRSQNDASLRIAQSFVNLLFAKEQLKSAEQQVQISERQVNRMQIMVDAGQEALNTLYDLQAQLANDKFTVAQAENTVNLTRLDLTNLLLIDMADRASFDIIAPSNLEISLDRELPNLATLYEAAVKNLPEVKAAELRAESSATGIEIAKGARMPRLDLRGSIGTGYSGNNLLPVGEPIIDSQTIGIVENTNETVIAPSLSFSDFETKEFGSQLDDNLNQSISFALTIPIFSAGRANANVSRAKLNYALSQVTEENTRNLLLQSVQQALADAEAASRSYEASLESLKAMELSFDNAEKRFEQGMLSPVDFNDAKSRMAVSEINLIRAKYDYLFRLTIIDFYLGQPIQLD